MDLLTWLKGTWFEGAAAVKAAAGGRYFVGQAAKTAPLPYLVVNVISEPIIETSDPNLIVETPRLQLAAYARTVEEARAIRDAVTRDARAGLDRIRNLAMDDSTTLLACLRPGGALKTDPVPEPDGSKVWAASVDYIFVVSRQETMGTNSEGE